MYAQTLGLIGVFPYQATDLGIYETLKFAYLNYMDDHDNGKRQPSIFVLWGCGMLSGSIGATSVYPLNVSYIIKLIFLYRIGN